MKTVQSVSPILLDIEGTTTPIDFVFKILFPYARAHAAEFLARNTGDPEVQRDLEGLRREHTEDCARGLNPPVLASVSSTSLVAYIDWLIERDRKVTPLKSLQGKIWAEGYVSGELHSQVFGDVPPALKRWHQQGRTVAIFSSGSVLAQKLLFGHTEAGDLTSYLSGFFDTTTGAKADAESYVRIARTLRRVPSELCFISDTVKELDAAREAGLETLLAHRPGNYPQPSHGYHMIRSFDGVFP